MVSSISPKIFKEKGKNFFQLFKDFLGKARFLTAPASLRVKSAS